MKRSLIILLIIGLGYSSMAQEAPGVLVSSGDVFHDDQGSLSWAIGSLYDYVDISDIEANSEYNDLVEAEKDIAVFKVYPTVTKEFVTIESPDKNQSAKTILKIYSPTGSILKVIKLTDTKVEMNISDYSVGSLFFTFFDEYENLVETHTILKSR